jgi:predicted kinase
MKTLIILRGLPGSGKSTLIQKLEQDYKLKPTICSADDYWYNGKDKVPENYKFDILKISKAHGYCKFRFLQAIKDEKELIIIDNTNIKFRDFKDYIVEAIKNNYKVICHSITGLSAEESFKLNIHNVPLETCQNMIKSFHPIPENIEIENNVYSLEEIVHDALNIRKGLYKNGKFN